MKKPDYAKLLSAYPLSQKIFADAEDAPLDVLEPPEVEPKPEGEGAEDEETPLYDPEQIKEDVRRNLALWTEQDIQDGDDQYKLLIDSLGDPEEAAAELKLGDAMSPQDPDYIEWVCSEGSALVADLAAEAGLPGKFEFELSDAADEEQEETEEPAAEEPPVEGAAEDEGENSEAPDEEEEIPSIDLVYKFSKADLDQLLSEGYALMQEGAEETSFDDIMSSLVEAGHEPMARRIYDILYPARKH